MNTDKTKICRTEKEYLDLMRTLERYNFHWRCGQNPTDPEVLNEIDYFPVKIFFGYWEDGTKKMTYSHNVD